MAGQVGIVARHLNACASRSGRRCNCRPTYQASVWSSREERRIKKSFRTFAEAKAWRAEAQTAIRRGLLRAPGHVTLIEVAGRGSKACARAVFATAPETGTSRA